MCDWLSGITDKNGKVFISKTSSSHTDIEEEFGLSDDGGESRVKWEYTPSFRKNDFARPMIDPEAVRAIWARPFTTRAQVLALVRETRALCKSATVRILLPEGYPAFARKARLQASISRAILSLDPATAKGRVFRPSEALSMRLPAKAASIHPSILSLAAFEVISQAMTRPSPARALEAAFKAIGPKATPGQAINLAAQACQDIEEMARLAGINPSTARRIASISSILTARTLPRYLELLRKA